MDHDTDLWLHPDGDGAWMVAAARWVQDRDGLPSLGHAFGEMLVEGAVPTFPSPTRCVPR
jgi:hypothetical protein